MVSASASLLLALLAVCQAAQWTYHGDHGPGYWADVVSGTNCRGQKQSPIDIVPASTSFTSFAPFDLSSYNAPVSAHILSNNGHTVVVQVGGEMIIRGGGLPGEYKVAQFHFHWGSDNTKGSEHTVSGQQYPMEVHIVHYRNNETQIGDALNKTEGLAVLGFFFEVSSEANTDPLLKSVIDNLSQVRNKDSVAQLTPQAFRPMLPDNVATFYRYEGSLTTPPCAESVVWTVFTNSIPVSASQMAEFRVLMSGEVTPYDKVVDNYRPVQLLHGRTVYRSFETLPTPTDSASSLTFSLLYLLLAALASHAF